MSEGILKDKKILCHIKDMARGGAERVMSVLIESMVNDGAQVVLVTLDKGKDEYYVPDCVERIEIDKNVDYSNSVSRFAKRLLSFRRILKEQKPDLVLSFCSKENFRCSLAMQGIKIPLLISVRSNPPEHYSSRILRLALASRIDGCVFQTENAKKYFSSKIQRKSCVITNPIDKAYFNEQVSYDRPDTDEIRMVTAGRLTALKHQIHMVTSFMTIADECPNAHLYIYGKDDNDGNGELVRNAIAENNRGDRIHLMGSCSTWPKEITKADIFVMSSVYEGMPNALLEAMVVGLPVISTDCPPGGPASVIEDGVNGRLVPMREIEPLAEAMKELINDKEKRKMFGQNAMKVRELVETDTVCIQWKEYMLSLIK